MSVTIRLRRMGKKKQPHYRIVAADSRAPRDGRFVENLGYYNPLPDPATLSVDLSRVDYWLGQGARVSPTVRSLVSKARAGGDGTVALAVADSAAEAEAQAATGNGAGADAPATAAGSDEAADTPEAATEPAEAADTPAATEPAEAADTPEATTEPAEAAAEAPGDTAGSEPASGSGAA